MGIMHTVVHAAAVHTRPVKNAGVGCSAGTPAATSAQANGLLGASMHDRGGALPLGGEAQHRVGQAAQHAPAAALRIRGAQHMTCVGAQQGLAPQEIGHRCEAALGLHGQLQRRRGWVGGWVRGVGIQLKGYGGTTVVSKPAGACSQGRPAAHGGTQKAASLLLPLRKSANTTLTSAASPRNIPSVRSCQVSPPSVECATCIPMEGGRSPAATSTSPSRSGLSARPAAGAVAAAVGVAAAAAPAAAAGAAAISDK